MHIAEMQIDEIRWYNFRRSAISRMLLSTKCWSTLSFFSFPLRWPKLNHVWRCNQFFLWVYITMYDIFKKSDRKDWLTERKIVDEKNASIDYRKNSAISISTISVSIISISMIFLSTIFLFEDVYFGVNFGHFTFRRFFFRRWGTQSNRIDLRWGPIQEQSANLNNHQ
jgi:hypothetical protein